MIWVAAGTDASGDVNVIGRSVKLFIDSGIDDVLCRFAGRGFVISSMSLSFRSGRKSREISGVEFMKCRTCAKNRLSCRERFIRDISCNQNRPCSTSLAKSKQWPADGVQAPPVEGRLTSTAVILFCFRMQLLIFDEKSYTSWTFNVGRWPLRYPPISGLRFVIFRLIYLSEPVEVGFASKFGTIALSCKLDRAFSISDVKACIVWPFASSTMRCFPFSICDIRLWPDTIWPTPSGRPKKRTQNIPIHSLSMLPITTSDIT